MSDTDLEALARKVEASTGACRETDARFWCAISADKEWNLDLALSGAPKPAHCTVLDLALDTWLDRFPENAEDYAGAWAVPKFTASIDAAMSLVPEGMLWVVANIGIKPPRAKITGASASVGYQDDAVDPVEAETPALALTVASLRALARLTPPAQEMV